MELRDVKLMQTAADSERIKVKELILSHTNQKLESSLDFESVKLLTLRTSSNDWLPSYFAHNGKKLCNLKHLWIEIDGGACCPHASEEITFGSVQMLQLSKSLVGCQL